MANRFFVPSPTTGGAILQGAQAFGNILQQSRANKIAADAAEIDKRTVGVQERQIALDEQAQPAITAGRLATAAGTLATAAKTREEVLSAGLEREQAEQERATMNRILSPMQPGDIAGVKATLKTKVDPLMGFDFSKSVDPLVNQIASMGAAGVSKVETFRTVQANWDTLKKPIMDDAAKQVEKLTAEGKVEQAQQVQQSMNAINDPNILAAFFPDSAKFEQRRALETEQASDLARAEQGVVGIPGTSAGVVASTGEVIKEAGTATGKDPVFEQKIDALVDANPGLTRQEATGLITKTISIKADPVTGTMFVVDAINKTQRILGEPEDTGQPPTQPEAEAPSEETVESGKRTVWEASDAGTGPFSALRSAGSVVSGAVGGPVATKTLQDRQFITTSQNQLIRALSINPRFPVGEIKRIQAEINLSPGIFDNPQAFKNRAISIRDSLVTRVENEKAAAKDRELPVAQRREARRAIRDIENFIDILGVPPKVTSDQDFLDLDEGDQFIDPEGNIRVKQVPKGE